MTAVATCRRSRGGRAGDRVVHPEQVDSCRWCGFRDECRCARWPGFNIPLWEGEKRNYALGPDELLETSMREALKPEAPLGFFVAVIRYFVETGS